MRHSYTYKSKRIMLRPLEKNDIEKLRILRNENSQFFFDTKFISKEQQIKWFEKYLTKTDDIMFAIEKRNEEGIFIGAVALYNINMEEGICEFGRLLIDKKTAPESGIGAETTVAACIFGFKVLKLNKIFCYAWKNNARILKVYKNAGFVICEDRLEEIISFSITEKEVNNDLIEEV